jgi:hypothetical protein
VGSIDGVEPNGYKPTHAVGNGRLELVDPIARSYPLVKIVPSVSAEIVLELKYKRPNN